MDHLLLHCSKTSALGFSFFPLWSLLDFVHHSQGLPLRMEGYFLAKKKRRVWNEGPLCIFWIVWKTRNGIVFIYEVLSIQRLKSLFVHFFG